MPGQREKEIKIIPLDNEQSAYFNWFLAFSYMLAPEDPKLQSNIFHHRLLQHVLANPTRARQFFRKKENSEVVRHVRRALMSKTVKTEMSKRKIKAKRIGEIVRFLNAMRLLEIDDPGVNKAYFLSNRGFKKLEEKKGRKMTYSRKTFSREVDKFNSVLHLCAAYSRIDPDGKKIKGPKIHKIGWFFGTSQKFREFLLPFKYTRQLNAEDRREQQYSFTNILQIDDQRKREVKKLITKPLLGFPENFVFPEVTIDIESAKFIGKVERLVKDYSSKWEDQRNKK
ncbi:hypothetical protein [Pseudodesulfovibrio karagichevae]|uniref:Uncharacterized protein n=1 Tax=Pseudodesulfovibrio karagichevae TaxID=3239305 RepID=A0ABV4K755_9BACT